MTFPHQGEIAALGTAFCWTMTALSFEAAGKRIGSIQVNIIRLVLAFFFLLAFCSLSRGFPVPSDAGASSWGWLLLSGMVGFFLGDLCLFRAFVVLGPRLSTLVTSMAPAFAAFFAWIALGESLLPGDAAGMAITIAGVWWVASERKPAGPVEGGRAPIGGILLALCGAAAQGGGLVISKHGMGDYDPFSATQIRVIAGVAGFIVLVSVLGRWHMVFSALKDRKALGLTAIGSFFGPFLGVSLSLMSVQYIPAGVAQTIFSMTPILIIPFVIILGKEKVSLRAFAGAVMAVAGVALLVL